MTHARLLVNLPVGPWIADISSAFPGARFRILTATPGDDGGFALVRIRAADVDAVLAAMRAHGSLETVATLIRGEDVATARIEASAPLLLLAAQRSAVPIRMTVGIATSTCSGTLRRVQRTGIHEFVDDLYSRLDGDDIEEPDLVATET